MKLIIVRHGETIGNKTGISQGHTHGELSKKGEKQAKKLAKRLLKEKIDVVYSSDLGRCRQTLKPYLKLNKVKVHYVKELREKGHGIFDGKKTSEIEKYKKSEKYGKWAIKNNINPTWYHRRFPGGESFKDLHERASKFIDKLIKRENGKNVLIFTHGGTKRMIIIHLLKKNMKHFGKLVVPNTAISIIHVKENGNHRARLLNNIKHLS